MKPRADKYNYAADFEQLKTIQGEVQRHKDAVENDTTIDENERANRLIFLYTAVSFDEGYRAAIKELKENVGQYASKPIKIKRHKKNELEYANTPEVIKLTPLIKKRLKSKRLRKQQNKHWQENNMEWEEERFLLTVAIHTGFEHGYMKGISLEETTKWISKDQERADLLIDMMKEYFPGDL